MDQMNLDIAKQIIDGAEKEAKNIGVQMVITVVDNGGNLIAAHRMDDAWIASVDISRGKAWTAVALKMPTGNLEDVTVPKAELWGLNTTNQGKIVVFGGGFPLEHNGRVVGAIGVSGGAVPQDVQVAKAGVKVFGNQK